MGYCCAPGLTCPLLLPWMYFVLVYLCPFGHCCYFLIVLSVISLTCDVLLLAMIEKKFPLQELFKSIPSRPVLRAQSHDRSHRRRPNPQRGVLIKWVRIPTKITVSSAYKLITFNVPDMHFEPLNHRNSSTVYALTLT